TDCTHFNSREIPPTILYRMGLSFYYANHHLTHPIRFLHHVSFYASIYYKRGAKANSPVEQMAIRKIQKSVRLYFLHVNIMMIIGQSYEENRCVINHLSDYCTVGSSSLG